jgi:hypothetical protein
MISTPAVMDVILENCLLGVLDLTLCRSLNSKSKKNKLILQPCLGQKLIFGMLDLQEKVEIKKFIKSFYMN